MTLLDNALEYAARGWCILPIGSNKRPNMKSWVKWQTERPQEAQLRQWFSKPRVTGLAVVCGQVSGGLAVRDFDLMAAYNLWASAHPKLAKTLPTVITARGRHVYFTGPTIFQDYGDSEYRGDARHYVLLPPSQHPSGTPYRWLHPLPNGPLSVLDPLENDLMRAVVHKSTERIPNDYLRKHKITECHGVGEECSLDSINDETLAAIANAIHACLPVSEGHRNRSLFKLVRTLKGIPAVGNMDPRHLEPIARQWHTLAMPAIATKEFTESLVDFIRGWGKVRHPRGQVIRELLGRARINPLPEATKYESKSVRLLAALCRYLQTHAGDQPFPLSARMAAEMLGVPTMTAWRYLYLLQSDGLLSPVTLGDKSGKATRFRFIADQPQAVRNQARMDLLALRLATALTRKVRPDPFQLQKLKQLESLKRMAATENGDEDTCNCA